MKHHLTNLLACAGFFAIIGTAAAAPPPPPVAIDFAVLGGSAVTLTNSAIEGDVGVNLGGAFTQTSSTVSGTIHVGDTVARQAYAGFLLDYAALAALPCTTDLTGQSLAGKFLTPGVYCFDAAATETGGVLTLVGSSTDTWIFKIGEGGTGALTATNFTVVMTNGQACDNNVIWWTAEAATLTDSVFIGSIYAGTSITVTRGSLDGSALAKVAVTLTGTALCGPVAQPLASFTGKVTGGGQIGVPNADSRNQATFGFNAKGNPDGTASGQFNYVNQATGLHINGPVDSMVVTVTNADGSPNTIRFSGTSGGNSFFTVTVQDNGEPGRTDQFGLTVTGALSEVESLRVISKGNIQIH
jgi:hypothetical protein